MSETSNIIDPELLSILRCPLTRSPLRQEGDFLIAETGGLAYPVRDGIPVMLIEEAKLPAGVESLDAFKQKFKDQIPHLITAYMPDDRLDYAAPNITSGGTGRPLKKWIQLLIVWLIGLLVWAVYLGAFVVFLYHC